MLCETRVDVIVVVGVVVGVVLVGGLVECTVNHPRLQRLRRQLLLTSTAPWLYQKVGYEPVNRQDYAWTFVRQDIYNTGTAG